MTNREPDEMEIDLLQFISFLAKKYNFNVATEYKGYLGFPPKNTDDIFAAQEEVAGGIPGDCD